LHTDCQGGNNDELYPSPFGFQYFNSIHYTKLLYPVQIMAGIYPQSTNDWPFKLNLSYDNNNQLSAIKVYSNPDNPTYTLSHSFTLSYKTTLSGKTITITRKDEKDPTKLPVHVHTLVYNKRGQLIRQFRAETFHNDYTYEYDTNGDVTRIYESAGENKPKELRWEYLSYDTRPNPANFSSQVLALLTGINSQHNPTKYIYHRYTVDGGTDHPIERNLSYNYQNGIPVKFDVTGFEIQLTDQQKLPLAKKGVFYCSFIFLFLHLLRRQMNILRFRQSSILFLSHIGKCESPFEIRLAA
jgi:hypothetical protein